MLGKYIKVNDVVYPIPTGYSETPMNIENVVVSESGDDLTTVTRLGKLVALISYRVTSEWRDKMRADCQRLDVRMEIDGKNFEGRLRLMNNTIVHYSEFNSETDGFWDVQLQFTES